MQSSFFLIIEINIRKKIEKSWSRVFTLMNVGNDMLVATTWELRKEWIREVQVYETLDSTVR